MQRTIAIGNRILASLRILSDGTLEFQAFLDADLSQLERETVVRSYLLELLKGTRDAAG